MFTSSVKNDKAYTPINLTDPTDTEVHAYDCGTTSPSHTRNNRLKPCFLKYYVYILHLIILVLVVFLFRSSRKANYDQSHFILESEIREYSSDSLSVILGIVSYIHIAWARGYVEYENTIFAPSGFTEDGSHATLYEGGSTPEIDARWSELIDGTKETTFLFLGKKIF